MPGSSLWGLQASYKSNQATKRVPSPGPPFEAESRSRSRSSYPEDHPYTAIDVAARDAGSLVTTVAQSAAEAAAKRVHQASASAAVKEWQQQELGAEMFDKISTGEYILTERNAECTSRRPRLRRRLQAVIYICIRRCRLPGSRSCCV